MKLFPVLSASAVLGLAACDTMNAPISHNGFDPLLTPGAGARSPDSTPAFKAGDLARAVMDNTFFFKKLPKGGAEADKTLLRGTGMKVTRVAGSYLEVELDVTGETGYVPAVMVENASIPVPGTAPGPGQTQLYPPLPGGPGDVNPIPPLDPRGLPPDGAIPTVIDPPTTPDPVPVPVPVPTPDAVPAPVPTPGVVPPPVPPAPEATPNADPVPPIEPKPAVPEKPKAEAPEETPIGAP